MVMDTVMVMAIAMVAMVIVIVMVMAIVIIMVMMNVMVTCTTMQDYMRPLAEASAMLPPMAMRGDVGVLRTVMRYWRDLIKNGGQATRLTGPFSDVIEVMISILGIPAFSAASL